MIGFRYVALFSSSIVGLLSRRREHLATLASTDTPRTSEPVLLTIFAYVLFIEIEAEVGSYPPSDTAEKRFAWSQKCSSGSAQDAKHKPLYQQKKQIHTHTHRQDEVSNSFLSDDQRVGPKSRSSVLNHRPPTGNQALGTRCTFLPWQKVKRS